MLNVHYILKLNNILFYYIDFNILFESMANTKFIRIIVLLTLFEIKHHIPTTIPMQLNIG